MAPQRLEALLKLSSYVANVHVHGDQKKYIVALIFLDRPSTEKLAKDKGIAFSSWEDLVKSAFIQDLMRNLVSETNAQLASYESIKKFIVLPNELSIEAGELTPSLKVKRKVLDKKFEAQIDSLYA